MKSLKTIWATSLTVAFLLLAGNSFAGVKVYVKVAPPARKKVVVVKPAKPWKHAIWSQGHWQPDHGKWVWVQGHWIKARAGWRWADGHWKHTQHGWIWIEGHWIK